MPVKPDIPGSRVNEACEAARAQKKPNLSKIAREYGVSYGVLRGRIDRVNCLELPKTPSIRLSNSIRKKL